MLGVLKDLVLMKCETRSQQIELAIGMMLFAITFFALGYWMYGVTHPSPESIEKYGLATENLGRKMRKGIFYFYIGFIVSFPLSALFSAISVVNLVRFITNTGLKDPGDW